MEPSSKKVFRSLCLGDNSPCCTKSIIFRKLPPRSFCANPHNFSLTNRFNRSCGALPVSLIPLPIGIQPIAVPADFIGQLPVPSPFSAGNQQHGTRQCRSSSPVNFRKSSPIFQHRPERVGGGRRVGFIRFVHRKDIRDLQNARLGCLNVVAQPGASITTVVCANRAISTSDCPAPTVSIRMISNPAASMPARLRPSRAPVRPARPGWPSIG